MNNEINVRTLKECDDDLFPNIYALLKISATIPAMSCECERSASSLRQLHTYNRACMDQERLSSLALMHIHYQTKISRKFLDFLHSGHEFFVISGHGT